MKMCWKLLDLHRLTKHMDMSLFGYSFKELICSLKTIYAREVKRPPGHIRGQEPLEFPSDKARGFQHHGGHGQ